MMEAYKIAWSFTKENRLLLLLAFVLNAMFSIFSALTISLIKPILGFLFQVEQDKPANDQNIEIGFFAKFERLTF